MGKAKTAKNTKTAKTIVAKKPEADVLRLWRRYARRRGDTSLRNQLVEHYLGIVDRVVRSIRPRLPPQCDEDMLTSAANLGLLQAVERYNPDSLAQFETYALPRVRGAVVDELRNLEPNSRSTLLRHRDQAEAEEGMAKTLGRRPTDDEVRKNLDWSERVYQGGQMRQTSSMDATSGEDAEGGTFHHILADLPENRVAWLSFFDRMTRGMEFPQRVVLFLHYRHGKRLREIAAVLDCSESRVSQLRIAGLQWLRTYRDRDDLLEEYRELKRRYRPS